MIPFKDTYYDNKLKEFTSKCYIKFSQSIGDFSIGYIPYVNGKIKAYMHSYRGTFYNYPVLKEGKKVWMAVTPMEIGGCFQAARMAKGKVGIVGLGLGYFVQQIIDKDNVEEVVVYEMSKEVIELYKMNLGTNSKLKIVEEDAFNIKDESFDFFFVDIYQNRLQERVVDDYIILNENIHIGEYAFWGLEHFILSCDSDAVKNAKLPESWIAMADSLGDRFYQSKYKENFISVDYKVCNLILNKFKNVFIP